MELVLARYLNGDLSDDESERLIRAVDEDPRLEQALREHETILEAAERLPRSRLPVGFTDRVMDRLGADVGKRRSSRSPFGRWSWLAAAAAVLVALVSGFWAGGEMRPSPTREPVVSKVLISAGLPVEAPGVQRLNAVRLVYSPSDPAVSQVSVAGSFNDWDSTGAPMVRDGNRWSIVLVLPVGVHEYMIVENGERWVTDPEAPEVRADGLGGQNGLLRLSL